MPPENIPNSAPKIDDSPVAPFLEKLQKLEERVASLEQENVGLKKELNTVTEINRGLLNKPLTHTPTNEEAIVKERHDRFIKFLKGE